MILEYIGSCKFVIIRIKTITCDYHWYNPKRMQSRH